MPSVDKPSSPARQQKAEESEGEHGRGKKEIGRGRNCRPKRAPIEMMPPTTKKAFRSHACVRRRHFG